MGVRSGWTGLLALARAAHPVPTGGVTAFATALAVAAGNSPVQCALIAAAVFAGQLTVGWTNDRHDVAADRLVGRPDKPLATGAARTAVVDAAIVAATAATVVLSLAVGWAAGGVHLGAVAAGWAYNFWIKGTWWSWLPYAVAFGALPAVATLALPGRPAPAAWAVAFGALIGVAANFTNVLDDIDDDRVTGFRGAPNRIGSHPSLIIAAALLVAATAGVAFGPSGAPKWFDWAGLAAIAAAAGAGVPLLWRRAQTRAPFYALMAVVPIDVVMILLGGRLS